LKYLELNIVIPLNRETGKDICIAELNEIGYESFLEDESGLLAYIPLRDFKPGLLESLTVRTSKEFGEVHISSREIEEKNWNKEWESNFEPVEVEKFCYLRSPYHKPSAEHRHEIIIEPKMSFGTGHHSTTWLMINQMKDLDFSGKDVLDVGSGTGVLAILASRMECKKVTGIDIDEWAYNNSTENIEINKVTNCSLVHGTVKDIHGQEFDIVLANITRNILLEEMEHYRQLCKDGGILIVSGFFEDDIKPIIAGAEKAGFRFIKSNTRDKWASGLFTA
jgi:ribosomal protein L11 methyltransferase